MCFTCRFTTKFRRIIFLTFLKLFYNQKKSCLLMLSIHGVNKPVLLYFLINASFLNSEGAFATLDGYLFHCTHD